MCFYIYYVLCRAHRWNLSSAGRASALQAEGHRFEPCRFHYGEIAQLARAHGSYPWCRGFKSLSRYDTGRDVCLGLFLFCYNGGKKCAHLWSALATVNHREIPGGDSVSMHYAPACRHHTYRRLCMSNRIII